MLKKIRVILSVLFFGLITSYFIDFRDVLSTKFHALAHIQFIPALVGINIAVIVVLVLIALLFGRIYCSSICPMGIYQDIITWFSKRFTKKKKRYKYSKAKNKLRWGILVITLIAFFAGFTTLFGLLDPYSAFGRMAVHLLKPIYLAGNNLLAAILMHFENYSFYKVDIFISSIFSFIISLLTLLIIGYLAWKHGRTFCNTICPVGTILGFLSKFSFFKIQIDKNQCNKCAVCAAKCKASCIDLKTQDIDYSRCVACFNCLDGCSQHAIKYRPTIRKRAIENNQEKVDADKRRFLMASAATSVAIPTLLAQNITNKLSPAVPTRQQPIAPPGAKSVEHLLHHCTSCHLCVSKCPTNIIKPAFLEYGLGGMMQPVMDYTKGFCNYDCTICSEVCPNHALQPLTVDEKHRTQIGKVMFVEDICIVLTEGTNCGACSEHCPTQAVKMEPYKNGLTIPVINPDICIGCGGCEFICPVRPHRAIFVEGNKEHQEAKVVIEEKKEDILIDDFGF